MSHCHVINQGGVGNAIFFAVSGFMAAAPFSRHPLEVSFTSPKDVLVYYAKRIMRIMPPYWAIVLTVNLVFPGTYFSSKRDLFSFLLLKNVSGHIWFMQNIMILYLMTPLIGMLIAALFGVIRKIFNIKASSPKLLMVSGIFLIIVAVYNPRIDIFSKILTDNGQPSSLLLGPFLIGMATSYFWRFLKPHLILFQKLWIRIAFDVASVAIVLFPLYTSNVFLLRFNPQLATFFIGWVHPLLCTLIFGILILLLLLNPNGLVSRLMSFNPFAIMGKVSFTIYLVHWYIIPLFSGVANLHIKVLAVYILSLGIAVLVYLAIEKPLAVLLKTKSVKQFWNAYSHMDIG